MDQEAALEPQAGRPDGQLVGDEQRLMALRPADGVANGRAHADDELGVGLAPARPQGVEVVGNRSDAPFVINAEMRQKANPQFRDMDCGLLRHGKPQRDPRGDVGILVGVENVPNGFQVHKLGDVIEIGRASCRERV